MPDKSTYDSVVASEVLWGIISGGTPTYRNPELDQVFDCHTTIGDNTDEIGVLTLTTSILGTWLNVRIVEDTTLSITTSIIGSFTVNIIAGADTTLEITVSLHAAYFTVAGIDYVPFTTPSKANWIKWSDIGSIDFTIGRDNVAGERPLDWSGYVHAIKKLGSKLVVYGENGVSLITPAGTSFGLTTIYPVGLKGKHAVAGDNTKHFFVDKEGQLWKLADGLNLLDYSEYLSTLLSNMVMSYDSTNNLIYMCDSSKGYVYDVPDGSLGCGPSSITGIGYQSGVQYIVSPYTIVNDSFEICTDIYDFGTRNGKTIHELEFGTDNTVALYAAIDYRRDRSIGFFMTPWHLVWKNGRVPINAYGREFRIRLRAASYEYFELDYIKVSGIADAY